MTEQQYTVYYRELRKKPYITDMLTPYTHDEAEAFLQTVCDAWKRECGILVPGAQPGDIIRGKPGLNGFEDFEIRQDPKRGKISFVSHPSGQIVCEAWFQAADTPLLTADELESGGTSSLVRLLGKTTPKSLLKSSSSSSASAVINATSSEYVSGPTSALERLLKLYRAGRS